MCALEQLVQHLGQRGVRVHRKLDVLRDRGERKKKTVSGLFQMMSPQCLLRDAPKASCSAGWHGEGDDKTVARVQSLQKQAGAIRYYIC